MSDYFMDNSPPSGKGVPDNRAGTAIYKKNGVITLEITDMNNLGAGVGHTHDGIAVFVTGAVTGDKVEAKIIKITSRYMVARLERLITASKHRIDADDPEAEVCEAPQSCGGCCYRNVKYEYELEVKRDYVKNAFRKAGLQVSVKDTASDYNISGYRNKAQYPVRQTKEGIKAGFFASGSHRLIPCGECKLQPPVFAEIVGFILTFAEKHGIPAYDEESGKGILRHIYLRTGRQTGEIMVCLVVNSESFPYEDTFADELTKRFGAVKSIMINVNPKNTNVIMGDRTYCIGGKPYINDILCGVRLRISANSFYQVNGNMAEYLYKLALRLADADKNTAVADLYCGIGSIGLSMAKYVKAVAGVEIVPEAVECARVNAAVNNIENASFFLGDAGDSSKLFSEVAAKLGQVPDVVILDPPRKGSTKELIDCIADFSVKKIVYVSCNPDTLARDCAYFARKGYFLSEVYPVDLFPRTGHVETIVLLQRETL